MKSFLRWTLLLVLSLAPLPSVVAREKSGVDVILWFDTEDYLLPADDDATKRLAQMLTARGIRATFKLVGEKARAPPPRPRPPPPPPPPPPPTPPPRSPAPPPSPPCSAPANWPSPSSSDPSPVSGAAATRAPTAPPPPPSTRSPCTAAPAAAPRP